MGAAAGAVTGVAAGVAVESLTVEAAEAASDATLRELGAAEGDAADSTSGSKGCRPPATAALARAGAPPADAPPSGMPCAAVPPSAAPPAAAARGGAAARRTSELRRRSAFLTVAASSLSSESV